MNPRRLSATNRTQATKIFVDNTKMFVDSPGHDPNHRRHGRPTPSWPSCACCGTADPAPSARSTMSSHASGRPAYTTALKLLQIMTEKGLVGATRPIGRTSTSRALSEEQTQRQLVRDLLDRAFGGSASKLVMQALAARRATPEELGEIRKLIESAGRREADDDAMMSRRLRSWLHAAGRAGHRLGAAAVRLAGRAHRRAHRARARRAAPQRRRRPLRRRDDRLCADADVPVVTAVQKYPCRCARRQRLRASIAATTASARSRSCPMPPLSTSVRAAVASARRRRTSSVAGAAVSSARLPPASRRRALAAVAGPRLAVGVLCSRLRLLTGWLWVQRLKHARQRRRRASRWQRMAARLSRRLHIVARVPSARVDAGRTCRRSIGWLKPVVLLPASALAGLSPAAARGDPRARARAHPPARLPGEPAADAGRDAAVLSSGRLVALAADPHRARELLRRSRRQPLRRSRCCTRTPWRISSSSARQPARTS